MTISNFLTKVVLGAFSLGMVIMGAVGLLLILYLIVWVILAV